MQKRPLCLGFAGLILLILVLYVLRCPLWSVPVWPDTLLEGVQNEEALTVTGNVTDRQIYEDHALLILTDSNIQIKTHLYSLKKIRIYLKNTEDLPLLGTYLECTGVLSFFETAPNPGGFDAKLYYASQDCFLSMKCENYNIRRQPSNLFSENILLIKTYLSKVYENVCGKDCGSALSAMLLGDKSLLSSEIRSSFQSAGLSHLLAISGLHIGIIGMIVLKLLQRFPIPPWAAGILACLILGFYCYFSGSSESTMRAFIMYSIMIGSKMLLRSYDALNALSLAGIILLLLNPYRLFLSGFILSFAAAAGLILFYPKLIEKIRFSSKGIRGRIKSHFISSFFVWLSVFIITFPFILYQYYEFPLYAFLPNLIFVFLMGPVMILTLIGSAVAFISPAFAAVFLFLPGLVIKAEAISGDLLQRLPFSSVITGKPSEAMFLIGILCLIAFGIFLYKRKYFPAVAAAGLMGFFLMLRTPVAFSLTALDVGQGDCLVLQCKDSCYLIDCGSSSYEEVFASRVLPYLKYFGIRRINGIFVSHEDADHINGIEEMLEQICENKLPIFVDRIYLPVWIKDKEESKIRSETGKSTVKTEYLYRGQKLYDNELKISVESPEANSDLSGNEGSMVLDVTYLDFNALLTGDIEGEGEKLLTESIGHYDYLKVAHHGSANSTSEEFLDKATPSISVISAPKKSIYEHPSPIILERLTNYGTKILQTGIRGAITVLYNAESGKFEVSVMK